MRNRHVSLAGGFVAVVVVVPPVGVAAGVDAPLSAELVVVGGPAAAVVVDADEPQPTVIGPTARRPRASSDRPVDQPERLADAIYASPVVPTGWLPWCCRK